MTKLLSSFRAWFILPAFLSLFQYSAWAQFNFNYAAAAGRVASAQAANMQMQQMQTMMNLNLARIDYKDNMFTNNKLTFIIKGKDSVSREVKSKIYMDTTLRKTYLLVEDKVRNNMGSTQEQRIYPTDTKEISIKKGKYEGTFLPRFTTDSCWIFKVDDGYINMYSNGLVIVALQKGSGPLLQFTKNNLKDMLSDDPKATRLFDKDRFVDAIDKYNSDYKP